MPANVSSKVSAPPSSRLGALLWLVPLGLAAALAYLFVAALKAGPRAPPIAVAPVAQSASFPATILEPGGRKVVVPSKPTRIVAADAGTADMLAALVEPERIAAVPFTVDGFAGNREFFATHKQIPRFQQYQAEAMLALKPDLVLAISFHGNATSSILEERGIPVLRFELFKTFAGIRGQLLAIGSAVGEPARAAKLAEDFDRRLAAVEKAVAGRPRPRTLGYSKYDQGFAVGVGESQDEVLRRAGAVNAAVELNLVGHVNFSSEKMLRLKPDFIVVSGEAGLQSPQAQIVLNDPVLRELPAVRLRRIAVVPDRYYSSPSQYVVDAVEILARQLHPEAFAGDK